MAEDRRPPFAIPPESFGTRLYAPSEGVPYFRVVTFDPISKERIFHKFRSEERARAKARELEQFVALHAPIRDPREDGLRTVTRLAAFLRGTAPLSSATSTPRSQ